MVIQTTHRLLVSHRTRLHGTQMGNTLGTHETRNNDDAQSASSRNKWPDSDADGCLEFRPLWQKERDKTVDIVKTKYRNGYVTDA